VYDFRSNKLGAAAAMNGACAAAATFEIRSSRAKTSLCSSDVLRMPAERVIADQHRVRIAAERAVFVFIDLLEEHAHVVIDGGLEILEQFLLGDVEQTQLQARARFGAVHHVMQARPRRFERLECLIVHDRVELIRQQLVDLRDTLVDHCHDALVRARAHAFIEDLRSKLADQLFGIDALRRLDGHIAFENDTVEQA
jgi:hypothetical protein